MVVSGGSNDAYYRCEGHAKRGICPNALSVRESIVRTNVLDELRRRLFSDQRIAYARKRLAERLGELERDRDRELRVAEQKLEKLERQIAHLIADGRPLPGVGR